MAIWSKGKPAVSDEDDKKAAQDIRGKLNSALLVVNGIIDAAKRNGYLVTYQTGELNGHQVVTKIDVVKRL